MERLLEYAPGNVSSFTCKGGVEGVQPLQSGTGSLSLDGESGSYALVGSQQSNILSGRSLGNNSGFQISVRACKVPGLTGL